MSSVLFRPGVIVISNCNYLLLNTIFKVIKCNCNRVFFSNTCNVIVMITENILAVIIITFKYFSNTFGYLLRKFAQHKKQNGD